MTAKWSVVAIFKDHIGTLVDARKKKRPVRIRDLLVFYGIPLVVAILVILPEFNFSWLASKPGYQRFADFRVRGLEGILSGVSIYTALLFGLLIQIFQIKARFLDRVDQRAGAIKRNDELEHNVSYAVLVGIFTTGYLVLVVATTPKDTSAGRIPSAIISFLIIHLILTLFMVLKRARAVYSNL
ncbi:hypothetical protein ACGFMK_42435 [Amycolatopsis sp. NPDC049252]|uniref:hypothetical protein n=1 Tax=Amycolatopsis sp. NPDC049252 TaxID=3363933 RepID=UPI00371FD41B